MPTPTARMQLATSFFRIMDRLTFRVWSVRPLSNEDLDGVNFNLRFRRASAPGEPEIWLLAVPRGDEMREALDRLLEVHDGEIPHARQHHELQSPRDTMRTFLEEWHTWRTAPSELFLWTLDLSRIPAATRAEEGALRGQYLK